jgi:hypothetical protein
LAGAVLFYSEISSEAVWQMLSVIIPELGSSVNKDGDTCGSPLAGLCPSKGIKRHGVLYPPTPIVSAGKNVCQKVADKASMNSCFSGYFSVSPRSARDPIGVAFQPLLDMKEGRTLTDKSEEELTKLEERQSSLEDDLKELEDEIGGRGESRFGANGELHSMKDSCYSIEAGKYVYEVCMFGKASQKEKGQGGSTSLGNWSGMEVNNETGERIFKWENGLRCWNGPNRSVTVIVKCGAEDKLISADEPQTCAYELEMESHIACDEQFFNAYLAET